MRDNYSDLIKSVNSLASAINTLANNQKNMLVGINRIAEELETPSILVDVYNPETIPTVERGELHDIIRAFEYVKRRMVKGEEGSRRAIDAAVKGRINEIMSQVSTTKGVIDDVSNLANKIDETLSRSHFALQRVGSSFEESIDNASRQADIAISNSIMRMKDFSEKSIREANSKIEEMREFSKILEGFVGIKGYIKAQHDNLLMMLDGVIHFANRADSKSASENAKLLDSITSVVSKIENGIAPLDKKIDAIGAIVESKLSRLTHGITLDETKIQTQPIIQGRASRRK